MWHTPFQRVASNLGLVQNVQEFQICYQVVLEREENVEVGLATWSGEHIQEINDRVDSEECPRCDTIAVYGRFHRLEGRVKRFKWRRKGHHLALCRNFR